MKAKSLIPASKRAGRVLSILLTVALVCCLLGNLTGCGKKEPEAPQVDATTVTTTTTTAATTATTTTTTTTTTTESTEESTTTVAPTTVAPTTTAKPTTGTTAVKVYTVTFKDHDGTVLSTQKVENGKSATAPANPSREHFAFVGWDKAFHKITSDLVVTATYTTNKVVISAESVTVNKGTDKVTVNLRVYNNPGIMGAVLKVSVNDKALAFASGSKTAYPGLTLTCPGSATTSSPYTFMLDALELSADDKKDGTLFSITFTVKDTTAKGTYDVTLSYDKGGIFDENYNEPEIVLENGTITIQ